MFCSDCGHKNKKGDHFCAKCGSKLIEDETAIPCCAYGYENIEGEAFCSECGKRLTEINQPNTTSKEVKDEAIEEL